MGRGKVDKAKSRKDEKFYRAAKLQGYRSRAAFKLVQLNKNAHTLLDLCAAPGGWMQVARKYMPVNSTVIGVDLDPIKPIPGCIAFQDDITSASCRKTIAGHLKNAKADVVLHDGAPNMGTNWLYDAFIQNDLTLKALKLATEFLRPNGTFVTKVFRSTDYNSLQWVMQKLFRKVSATKPTASRAVSAEIFVVCEGYLAPHKLDPRFLDSRHVFKDVAPDESSITIRSFEPQKKARKNRQGYSGESDVLIGDQRTVSEFMACEDPIVFLFKYWVLNWDEEAKAKYWEHASEDLRDMCADLKRMGKADAKAMLRWRTKMRALYKDDFAQDGDDDEDGDNKGTQVEPLTVEDELDALIQTLDRREKRKVRKQREAHKRALDRSNRGITREGDEIEQVRDEELFNLERIWSGGATGVDESDDDDAVNLDSAQKEEETFHDLMERYLDEGHRNSKKRKIKVKGGWGVEVPEEGAIPAPRAVEDAWFSQNVFDDVLDMEDEVEAAGGGHSNASARHIVGGKRERSDQSGDLEVVPLQSDVELGDEEDDEDSSGNDEATPYEDPDDPAVRQKRLGLLTLGRQVLSGKSNLKDLVDDSFNKWASKEEDLPEWFAEDDGKFWKPHGPSQEAPVTKEDRERVAALSDRPIKKVAEARARRKKRMRDQLARASTKASAIASNSELPASQRIKAIKKLYSGVKPSERGKVYMVGNRQAEMSKVRTAKGKTKGQIKMVDARMKRDRRRGNKLGKAKKPFRKTG